MLLSKCKLAGSIASVGRCTFLCEGRGYTVRHRCILYVNHVICKYISSTVSAGLYLSFAPNVLKLTTDNLPHFFSPPDECAFPTLTVSGRLTQCTLTTPAMGCTLSATPRLAFAFKAAALTQLRRHLTQRCRITSTRTYALEAGVH